MTTNRVEMQHDNPVHKPARASDQPAGRRAIPHVFLMIDSLQTGGSERQFAMLAGSLDANASEVHLGCIQERGAFLEGLGNIPEFRLGGSGYSLKSLRTRWRLSRHLRRHDIAIAHAFDFYSNISLIPAARLARVPVVIGSQRQLGDLLSPMQSRAQTAMLQWCDAVICNSHAAAERLRGQGVRANRIVVIGNALPPSAFASCEPALPPSPGLLRVGMIARMNTPAKNHTTFLRIAATLRTKFPEVRFVLIGDGPLRQELEHQAERLGVADRVCFLGDRRDIPAILASLDVTVLPSSSESLSNSILESMAAGVPVVAYEVGGNPELVNPDRGVLVSAGNELGLAAGLERLLRNNSLRAAMGRNAREFAEANFTVPNILRQYENLYTELLEKSSWQPHAGRATAARHQQSDRLRVAIVAASLRYVGGQSAQADLLIRKWRDDPEVEAEFIPIDPSLPAPLAWVERVPFLRTLVRTPLYALRLWQGLAHVDIVHIFSASYWSFLVAPAPAWLLARLKRKKALIHYHSGEARDHLQRFPSARAVLKQADRLVVPSGYLVKVFEEFGLSADVVPNAIELSQFRFRFRKPLRPHLVCTRGFHPYYCIDLVVRAFGRIKQTVPDARLDLVGTGPLESQVKDLVKQLNLSDINFTGVASREEIAGFYDRADIFINGSRLDNMPVSILEAFASGTPVVSTAPEGMRYVVEHERTGLLCEPGDAEALAANVIRLLRDPVLASRLASNAHDECQQYSWEAVRDRWLEVYRSVARGERSTSPRRGSGASGKSG